MGSWHAVRSMHLIRSQAQTTTHRLLGVRQPLRHQAQDRVYQVWSYQLARHHERARHCGRWPPPPWGSVGRQHMAAGHVTPVLTNDKVVALQVAQQGVDQQQHQLRLPIQQLAQCQVGSLQGLHVGGG